MSLLNKNRRTHPRFRVRLETKVAVQSIGTQNPYNFVTENVSLGGVYIKGEQTQYPFRDASILEVWLVLDEAKELLVFFNGKIVHNRDGGFGIRVIQITDQAAKVLENFLIEYKNKHPDRLLD